MEGGDWAELGTRWQRQLRNTRPSKGEGLTRLTLGAMFCTRVGIRTDDLTRSRPARAGAGAAAEDGRGPRSSLTI